MGWFDWLRRNGAEDSWTREWRTEWAAAVEHPEAAAAAALRARLDAAGPDEERFEIEREMLEGLDGARRAGRRARHPRTRSDRDRPSRGRGRPLLFQRPGQRPGRSRAAERHPAADEHPRGLHRRRPGGDDPVARGRPGHAAEPGSGADPQRSPGPPPLPLQHLRGRDAGRLPGAAPLEAARIILACHRPPPPPVPSGPASNGCSTRTDRCSPGPHRPRLEPGVDRQRLPPRRRGPGRRSRDRRWWRSSARSTASGPTCRTT